MLSIMPKLRLFFFADTSSFSISALCYREWNADKRLNSGAATPLLSLSNNFVVSQYKQHLLSASSHPAVMNYVYSS